MCDQVADWREGSNLEGAGGVPGRQGRTEQAAEKQLVRPSKPAKPSLRGPSPTDLIGIIGTTEVVPFQNTGFD